MKTENNNPLLTIAIPTYNRKNLLKRALESIIPQLNSRIEILVSDNASDDGTDAMIAESFPMIRYIKNETNVEADNNFLQCYREARGKYVILLGSDDRLAEGALTYITDFLEKNDYDLVFLNYKFYDVTKKEIYIKKSEWIKSYKGKQDIITKDRNLFIKYSGHSITFMSASIVKRSNIMKLKDPEIFLGTHFIHAHMIFESVKETNALFGVVMKPLIEANATAGESEMSKKLEKTFTVFGKNLYSVLCVHAVECGFKMDLMKNVYLKFLHDCPFWKLIILVRGQNNARAMKNFWEDGYPVVKHFPSEWIKVILVAITPRWVINMIYKIYKTFKKDK